MEWELLKIHSPQAPLKQFSEGGRTERQGGGENQMIPLIKKFQKINQKPREGDI